MILVERMNSGKCVADHGVLQILRTLCAIAEAQGGGAHVSRLRAAELGSPTAQGLPVPAAALPAMKIRVHETARRHRYRIVSDCSTRLRAGQRSSTPEIARIAPATTRSPNSQVSAAD